MLFDHDWALSEARVEVARPQPFEVQCDVAVPGGTHGGDDVVAAGDSIDKVVDIELYPGELAIMPHAQRAKAECTKSRLGNRDCAKDRDGDRRPVGNARREAGRCGFVPGPETQGLGSRSHVVFGKPRVDEWKHRATSRCSLLSRTVVTEVVDIHPQDNGRFFALGKWGYDVEKRVLAVSATSTIVRRVGGIRKLVCLDFAVTQRPLACECSYVGELFWRERG